LKKRIEARNIADVAIFLSSPASDMITGHPGRLRLVMLG
jgi:enoyl-[acyl-carrier-protein] reductase (NADH)